MPDHTMSFLDTYLYLKNQNDPVTNSGNNADYKILQSGWRTFIPDQTYPNKEQQSVLFLDLSFYAKNEKDLTANSGDHANQIIRQSD